MNNKTQNADNNTEPKLNHLGKPFAKKVHMGHKLRTYGRQLARRLWRESFGAKVIWRNSRQAGNGGDCSFRIYTGRCAT